MKSLHRAAQAAFILAAALWLPGHAHAVDICGTVTASGTAPTQERALALANTQGLKVTNQLDAKYGNKVKYEKARWSCSGSVKVGAGTNGASPLTCKITQKYCVTQSSQGRNPANGRVDPKTAQCKTWDSKCKAGNNFACANYESNCQND